MLRRLVGALTVVICALVFSIPQATQADAAAKSKTRSSAHVYFLTGFMGIGSRLDAVAERVRSRGIPITMASPGGWQTLASAAINGYRSEGLRSIVIVGYSAGGGAALDMAARLHTANVPVQLVMIIDGSSGTISPNVRRLINVYVVGGFGAAIVRPRDFRGTIQNIPITGANVGHFTIIDQQERQLLGFILAAAGRR
jgi:hypothetical protein